MEHVLPDYVKPFDSI